MASLRREGNAFDGAVLGGRPSLLPPIAALEYSDPQAMAEVMASAIAQPCEPLQDRQQCELFIVIFSAAGYERRRRMLRNTYLSLLRSDNADSPLSAEQRKAVKYRFVLGAPLPEQVAALEKEQRDYGDLVHVPVFESYETIWPKLIAAWRWSVRHLEFCFWMHADDDSYVRLELLLEYLRSPETPRLGLYAGYIWDGSEGRRTRPLRDPAAKSYMPPEQWPSDSYPPFASGCGFILSADLVMALVGASPSFSFFRTHDVSVGIELSRLDRGLEAPALNIVHLDGVRPYRPLPIFREGTIVQHYLQPEEMPQYHAHAYPSVPQSIAEREADERIAAVYDMFVRAKVLRR